MFASSWAGICILHCLGTHGYTLVSSLSLSRGRGGGISMRPIPSVCRFCTVQTYPDELQALVGHFYEDPDLF